MLPCLRRNEITEISRDGLTIVTYRCAHIGCEQFTKPVAEADCAACVLRVPHERAVGSLGSVAGERQFDQPRFVNGELIYPKTGWEPPKEPEGFKRKNDDPKSPDAWVFIPNWPECAEREMHGRTLPCGCVNFAAICASKRSGKEGQLVTLGVCEACPVRSKQVDVQQSPV